MIALIVLIIILTLTIPLSIFTVNQQTAAVIERFGKFKRIANAGLNFKIPLIDRVAGKLSLRSSSLT
jgi:regulator of protease activity HflC (stomatin/prohibitin superfamily)